MLLIPNMKANKHINDQKPGLSRKRIMTNPLSKCHCAPAESQAPEAHLKTVKGAGNTKGRVWLDFKQFYFAIKLVFGVL